MDFFVFLKLTTLGSACVPVKSKAIALHKPKGKNVGRAYAQRGAFSTLFIAAPVAYDILAKEKKKNVD